MADRQTTAERLAEAIQLHRDRRYWTPDQWREVVGDEFGAWPKAAADTLIAHDAAVDEALSELSRLVGESDQLKTERTFYSSLAIELAERHDTLRNAAQEVADAHNAIIEGVTPKHPNWCANDQDEYEARFSRWHATTRALKALLAAADSRTETPAAPAEKDKA